MGFSFLPSEVARLVLGYLEEQKCTTAYDEFLNTSKHLEECKGRSFLTQIMGMSLTDILDDYCAVHSYVTNAICDDRVKQELKKRLNLLDKIKLSLDGIAYRHESTDVSPKNISQRIRKRCNSANSISTIHSEKSHNLSNNSSIYAKDLDQNIDEPKCLNENITESTNLADLPGHKEEFHTKQKDEKYLNNTNLNSKLICKRKFSKSLDNLCPNKTIKDINLMDFRHALGLVKQTDLLEKNSKAIVRRKGYKPRICLSARKSNNENFLPNESLSIATISNTLLDFPELHRKIADNINKIKNERNPFNKTDLTDTKNSGLSVVRHEFNEVSENSNMLIDDFSEDIENVVKSIVDITAKDPIFDQIINELAASFENISGSDSDIISRPDTSTPEINSSNAVSRTSSFGSYENDLKKYKEIRRLQKSKNSKPEISNLTEPVSDTVVVSSNNQKSFPRKLKSQENHPRYPRGGKKMDILKANYGKNISQNSTEIISINEKPPASLLPEVSQPKVIILSNERVQTNIVSTSGPIIISNIESFNENNKVVSIPKSKIPEEKTLSTNVTKKDLKYTDDIQNKQQSKDLIVEENNENIYFESEIVSSEFELVNMPQIISINEETKKHCYDNLPSGFIRLLPKIETHPDYPTFVEIEEPNKPNCEFQIIDAKGFGVFTSNVNSIAETSGSVPLILPTSYNSTVPTQTKQRLTLNTNSMNLEEINILNIDNSESIENQISSKTNDIQLNDCVIIEINDSVDKNEKNLKTPNGVNTVKKFSSSTPRKNSHIRILDFSTPEKTNVGKRKAATSPKSTSYNFRNSRSLSKSKIQSKVRLFNPISEEQTTSVNDNNDIIILDPISPLKKVKSGKKSTIEKSCNERTDIEKKSQNNSKKNKKLNNAYVPNLAKSKSSWDRDLRAMLGESYIKCKDIKAVNNTNKAKSKVSKASKPQNPDSSLENDAKRLEDALNKTQDTSVCDMTVLPKKTTSGNDKLIINNEQVLLCKSDSSVPNIIDDLDLSTNTSLDDSQCATPKNIVSDNLNTPADNLNFKPLKDSNSFHSSFSKKNQMNDLDNILDFPPESKKENHSSSTIKTKIGLKPNLHKFKLKIGPQMPSGKKYDGGMNTRIDLSNPYVLKELGSTNDDPQNVEDISKSSLEQDDLDSSLITPELPREYRSNPAEVKCNLNSILETPFKTCVLDSTMTTPRFLSPGIHLDPLSMVKILGIPTPKFEDTPIMSKTPELSYTPGSFSSKKTDYSSGSSYYKPDEIDANFLTNLSKEKKKPNIFSKSPRKKSSGPSSISKLLNFRRKVCGRPKKKSPVKKVLPVKKKVLISKPKKENSKPLPKKTTEYSLRSSTTSRKVTYENEKINIKKSPNESLTSKSSAKYSNVSKRNKKDTKCDSKKKSKCDIQTNKEVKENVMTEKSSKVSFKDKFGNEVAKSDSKTSKVKFSTVTDDIFSINKNLILPYVNSPSKSKRKSSTPRKIHSLSSQIDGDYIDSSMEFHNLLKSNKAINRQSDNLNEKSSNQPKLTSKNDTSKECFESNVEKPKNLGSSAFKSPISKKLEESEIDLKLSKEIFEESSDYTGQDIDDSHTLEIPKFSTDTAKNDVCETIEIKSESSDLPESNMSTIAPEQIKQDISNISTHKPLENDEMTINECPYNPPVDESEPYVYITWSKHEAICHYEVSDYSLKKLPKQTETKRTIELEKLNMNVEVFDTETDSMKVTSLKASNFIDLFDIQSDLKRKNKVPSLKKPSDKHNSKPIDKEDMPRSGLQMLMEDLSSTPESSPIKNIVMQRKTGDYIATEHETEIAIKSILVEDNNIFSPIKIKYKNLYSDSPENKTTNITIEKRKREGESDVTLKKSKSDKTANSYAFKNFDIEEVLSKLHGTD